MTSWPLQLDQARGRRLEAADHPQGRGLAAAGRAEQAEELPGLDLEVDVVDDDGLAVALDDIDEPDVDGGHVRSHSSWDDAPRPDRATRMRARIWARSDRVSRNARPSRRRRDDRARFARIDAPPPMESVADATRSRSPRRQPRRRGTISTRPTSEPTAHATSRGTRPPMPSLTHDAVIDAMRTVQEPELGRDLVTLDMVKNVVIDGSDLSMTIELTTPACPLKDEIERTTHAALGRHRRDRRRHHLGRDGPPVAAAPGRAAGARASRTSSPSRPARAASARARSASTSRSRWPRPAPRSACSTPTSPARTSR